MKKIKANEKGKTIAVSVVSIGLLSAMFIGVNSLVFAAESNKTESLTPDKTTVEVTTQNSSLSVDFQEPSLTIYELDSELDNPRKASAMSYENAAQIGAQHIWEIFGEHIDGMFVEMFYEVSAFTARTYWTGIVFASQEDMDNGNPLFNFIVDAISGEKKSAQIFQDIPFQADEAKAKEPYFDNTEKLVEISMEYEQKRKENARKLYNENPQEYAEIAKDAAQKHFTSSTVAEVVYLEDRSNDGIVFLVTDDTGHEIEVAIYSETKQVEFVDDRVDEIDPNYVPDPNAVG